MDEEATLGKDADEEFEMVSMEGKDADEEFEMVSMEGQGIKLRLILVGKSGGGKSATGNTILGRKEFESILALKATTLKCQMGQGSLQDNTVYVVDTPDMFDSEDCDEILQPAMTACLELSKPGPHALIFVTQVGRFTAEDAAAAKCVLKRFGPESIRHMIVLFTCLEDLGGDPLDKYVTQSDNRNLQELIQQCENRFCGFNNKAEGYERERQVSELMKLVEGTFLKNGSRYYINQTNLQDEQI